MAEKGECEGFVSLGNGAIAKVEDAAKFCKTTGSFGLLHMLCQSPKCVDIPVGGSS